MLCLLENKHVHRCNEQEEHHVRRSSSPSPCGKNDNISNGTNDESCCCCCSSPIPMMMECNQQQENNSHDNSIDNDDGMRKPHHPQHPMKASKAASSSSSSHTTNLQGRRRCSIGVVEREGKDDDRSSCFHRLSEETQFTLKVASCLGKVMPFEVLQYYFLSGRGGFDDDDDATVVLVDRIKSIGIQNVLDSAVEYEILIRCCAQEDPSSISSSTSEPTTTTTTTTTNVRTYMWSYDNFHNVVYSLIPEETRPSLHTKLGKILWKLGKNRTDGNDGTTSSSMDDDIMATATTTPNNHCRERQQSMILMAADQLNRYPRNEEEDNDDDEDDDNLASVDLVRLNLEAAKISMSKSALFPAMSMLRTGIRIMEESCKSSKDRWNNNHYDLSLEIYTCLSEVGVQIGFHKEAMDAIHKIDANANCLDDKFRSQCAMLKSITSGNNRDYKLGVERTIDLLKLYGEKLPTTKLLLPGQLYLETQKLKSNLPGGELDGFLDLPIIEDSRSSCKVTTLIVRHLNHYSRLGKTQIQTSSIATTRALNIACQRGVSSDTALAVIWMAEDLKRERHYQQACECADFAIRLIDKFKQERGSLHGLVWIMAYANILPVVRPFNNMLEPLLECHKIGLKTGETEPAIGSILGYTFSYLSVGLPIGPLEKDLISFGQEARQLSMPYTVQVMFKLFRQAVLNLMTTSSSSTPTIFNGEAMDEDMELAKVDGGGAKMTIRDITTFRLMISCVFHDWDIAEKSLDILKEYLTFEGLVSRAHFRMTYVGLAAFALCRKYSTRRGGIAAKKKKNKFAKLGKKIIHAFKDELKLGSVNAYPVLALLEAEASPSKERYEKAIKICARLGLIQHEAYMCERAGIYFLEDSVDHQDLCWSKYYLLKAYTRYNDWGATAKLDAMEETYNNGKMGSDDGNGLFSLSFSSSDFKSFNFALKGRSRYTREDQHPGIMLREVAWTNLMEKRSGSKEIIDSNVDVVGEDSGSSASLSLEDSTSRQGIATSSDEGSSEGDDKDENLKSR